MKTLTEIQNDFAIKNGYKNITELMEESVRKGNTLLILLDLDKICIKVQQEQQKLIVENAKITLSLGDRELTEDEIYNGFNVNLNDIKNYSIKVSKSSIINENNIIR